MKSEYLANAEWALEVLLRGSVNERQDLRDRLEFEEDSKIDKAALSAMILEQLNGDFQESAIPPNPEDHPKRWTRHWLLTILGRLGSQDTKATAMLVQIATKRSSSKSGTDACYWAMEALIKMNPDNLPEIAQTVYDINFAESTNTAPAQQNASSTTGKVEVNTVYSLALAVLANEQLRKFPSAESSFQKIIVEGLSTNYGHRRAMRVVPLPDAIIELCKWMDPNQKKDMDSLADAVQALSALPVKDQNASMAAEALATFIRRARHHSWWNSLHAMALHGLGRFRNPEAVPLLIEELGDPHPAILYEAAKALEATVGVAVATDRIVEAASKKPRSMIFRYANALRYMDRPQVANQLEHLMFSGGLTAQESARNLLAELGGREAMDKLRNRSETMKAHREAIEKTEENVKRLFDKSLEEARSGYTISTSMNFMLFLVGLAFMAAFLFLIMRDPDMGNNAVSKLIAGGGGAFVLVYNMFFARTRDQVRESAEHLLGLKVIFLGYLRQLHQTDQAYVRRYLEDKSMATTELREYADLITATMQTALAEIKGNMKGSSDYVTPSATDSPGSGSETH